MKINVFIAVKEREAETKLLLKHCTGWDTLLAGFIALGSFKRETW